jgi:hypothetical protein
VTFPSHGQELRIGDSESPSRGGIPADTFDTPVGRELEPIQLLDEDDPGVVVRTCANCGGSMDERKCKLICRCGYFLSCSDYY